MNNYKFRSQLKRAAINLAPSAAIVGVIVLGAAVRVPWFELSWSNDVLFVILAFAALLPLTKLPLLFLTVEDPLFWQFGTWAGESAQARALHLEWLQQCLDDSSLMRKRSEE